MDSVIDDHDNDLPLMANISDVHVYHYVMSLQCLMEQRTFSGWITLFCEPVNNEGVHSGSGETVVSEQQLADRGFVGSACEQAPVHSCELNSISSQCSSLDNEQDIEQENMMRNVPRVLIGSDTEQHEKEVHSLTKMFSGSTCEPMIHTEDKVISVPQVLSRSEHEQVPDHEDIPFTTNTSIPFNSVKEKEVPHLKGVPHVMLSSDFEPSLPQSEPVPTNKPSVSSNCEQTTPLSEHAPYISPQVPVNDCDSGESILTHLTNISDSGSKDFSGNHGYAVQEPESSDAFILVLDCNSIIVESVQEISVQNEISGKQFCNLDKWNISKQSGADFKFSVEENCLKIWKQGIYTKDTFPKVVKIYYRTLPEGLSLKWTPDQDGRLCVFTHGNWINNRSWFPSQDVPTAMATWQAEVKVTQEHTVIMSGDQDPVCADDMEGWRSYKFFSDFEMPTSTLSLAIGCWREYKGNKIPTTENSSKEDGDIQDMIPAYRLYLPESLHTLAPELHTYLPVCLRVVGEVLGPYPFFRQEVLVVPSCFDSLGMASPSVLYLAQSVLAGDYSMCVRVAHEICHTWFGIVIGPRDWTEEWLTEGFCTYLEDIVHARVMESLKLWTGRDDMEEYRGVRDILKYRILAAEINNTSAQLQSLRPNREVSEDGPSQHSDVQYVKDGKNPNKKFMQLHYLKGYFLLCYLESLVGMQTFLRILKNYVQHFHGKLITSKEAVSFIVNSCSTFRDLGITYEKIANEWLDNPGMPKILTEPQWKADNKLLCGVQKTVYLMIQILELKAFQEVCKKFTKRRPVKRKVDPCVGMIEMTSDALVLFLEMLLDEEKIPSHLLERLKKKYSLCSQNADIQHRWCELVIKHKVDKHYTDIKNFLINHQAMGVYLYGELVLAGSGKLKQIAETSFQLIKSEMEPDSYKTVHAMLYGN